MPFYVTQFELGICIYQYMYSYSRCAKLKPDHDLEQPLVMFSGFYIEIKPSCY